VLAGPRRVVRRRKFIALIGGAAFASSLAARAQQPAKLPTIGYPGPGSQRLAAFVKRLRDLSWIEGRTIAIEYRWAEGRNERLAEIAAEFVRLQMDVIVTGATPPRVAVKQATSVIPIVFAGVALCSPRPCVTGTRSAHSRKGHTNINLCS
jgi:putative tryptophan/tyrosine transport system substrate-binding protein